MKPDKVRTKTAAGWLAIYLMILGTPADGASPTSLTLTPSATTMTLGALLSVTAQVTPAGATGRVTIYNGTSIIGVSSLSAGSATVSTSSLAPGSHTLTARYGGDATYAPSSAQAVRSLVQAVPIAGFVATQLNFPVTGVAALADFNGDGKRDLAAAGYSCQCVKIYLGNGDATFTASQDLPLTTSSVISAVVVGDFNGDGRKDIAIADSSSNAVVIYAGKGDGTFAASVKQPLPSATALFPADFNNDGITDLGYVSIDGGITKVGVLIGRGDGTFDAGNSFDVTRYPFVAVGDFDADGNADFAVTASSISITDGQVQIFWGRGDGTFSPTIVGTFPFIASPYSLAVGDFDGDGIPDLAAILVSTNLVQLDVFLGNKNRTPVLRQTQLASAVSVSSLATGDFNGDGRLDLLDTGAGLMAGNGDGTFQPPVYHFYPIGGAGTVLAGEFNGDGRADFIFLGNVAAILTGVSPVDLTSEIQSSASWFQGQMGATFSAKIKNQGANASAGPVTATLSGNVGLVRAASGTGWSCVAFSGSARCSRTDSLPAGASFPEIAAVVDVLVTAARNSTISVQVEVAGDTNPANDIVNLPVLVSQLQQIAFGTLADRTFDPAPFSLSGVASSGLPVTYTASGPCNVQGALVSMTATGSCSITASQAGNDVYLPAPAIQRTFRILAAASGIMLQVMPETSPFGAPVTLTGSIADGDATGKVTFYDGPTILGTATVTGGTATMITRLVGTGNRLLRAHYTGDSKYPPSNSAFVSHVVEAVPGFGLQTTTNPAQSALDLHAGDFDGDGIPDLLSISVTSLTVYPGNGDGTFRSGITTNLGNIRAFGGVVGDFNGDGKLDLVSFSGGLLVYFGNGDGTFATQPVRSTADPGLITVGDFNNDGYPDVAIAGLGAGALESTGTLEILLNKGNGTFESPLSYSFPGTNVAGTNILPLSINVGDLDGDGNLDLVAVTPSYSDGHIDNRVTVFMGDGTGAFVASPRSFVDPAHYSTGGAGAVTLGDVNRDGVLDLIIASTDLRVLIGNGDGTFQQATTFRGLDPLFYTSSVFPIDLHVVDANGDGNEDIVVSLAAGTLEIFPGVGDGTFETPAGYSANAVAPLALGDFNGDGRVDFATPGFSLAGGRGAYLRVSLFGPPVVFMGQRSALYTLVVKNADSAVASQGPVTVKFRPNPYAGVAELFSLSGAGWTCATFSCARADGLPPGASFPAITAVVDIDSNPGAATVLATAVLSGGASPSSEAWVESPFQNVPTSCQFSVRSAPAAFSAAPGSGSISVVAPAGCGWSANSNAFWISVTSRTVDTGNGAVTYSVSPNPSAARTGQITVAGQNIAISQAAGPATSSPVVSWVANAFSGIPLIAPNTWVQIGGSNLARPGDSRIWADADFAGDRMPTQLDSVSATVNGKPAYVYFISETQVNILTPPDALPASVPVQLTMNGAASNVLTVAAQPQSISFFELVSDQGLHYVFGRHGGDNSLIGPASLFPGYTTPVRPGETFYVAATGFGPTDIPIVSGSVTQAGSVPPPLPIVTIGGLQAQVTTPTLVAVGTFQINITVPAEAPTGDLPLSATYGAGKTQINLLISVQR